MTTTFDNQRLHDLAAVNSVLLESVKLYEFEKRLVLFRKLKKDLGEIIYKVKYDTLNFMTKKEVNGLIKQIKDLNKGFYSSVAKDVELMFDEFANRSISAQKKRMVGLSLAMENDAEEIVDVSEEDADLFIEEQKRSGLFPLLVLLGVGTFAASLKNKPITGFGQTLNAVLTKYNDVSGKRFEDIILKAWSSGYTKDEIARELLGDPSIKQGRGVQGALGTMRAQLNAIIDTSIGFAHEQAHMAAISASGISNKYIWISVMDGRTSYICIGRNRKIYVVNKGPLPPAHANCRSSTAPYIDGNGGIEDMSFAQWVEHLDEKSREDIKKYGIIDKSTGKYKATFPMKLDEFFNRKH